MTRFLRASLPLVILTVSATAYAGAPKVLISAPISNDAGGVSCTITNAGSKTVTLAALETVGDLMGVALLHPDPVVLEPGDYFGRANGEVFGYCRFTIEGSTKGLRAAACRYEAGLGPGTNLDCVEAR
jgi:hypothetical protein